MADSYPLLIDVTGLLAALKNRRHIPKGIERVAYAYVENYKNKAHAVIYVNKYFYKYFLILPFEISQQVFELLLNPSVHFAKKIRKLVLKAVFQNFFVNVKKKFKASIVLKLDYSLVRLNAYTKWINTLSLNPIFMLYDLIPIKYPEYFVQGTYKNYKIMLAKMLSMASGIITDSAMVLDELISYTKNANQRMPAAISALLAPGRKTNQPGTRPIAKPYFVILGTIEPRKNHLLLLQVWRRLVETYAEATPQLVIIGQRGWKCEQVVDLLERCQQLKGYVIEHAATDAEVITYLSHAQALLFPTFAEGYGLPLIEALTQGTPVIASDLPVFHEIAGNVPEYLDQLDGLGWLEMIMEYIKPNSIRRVQQLQRIALFELSTWRKHFEKVDAFLNHLCELQEV